MIDWNGSPMISIEIRKWSYTQLIMNSSAEDDGFGKWMNDATKLVYLQSNVSLVSLPVTGFVLSIRHGY